MWLSRIGKLYPQIPCVEAKIWIENSEIEYIKHMAELEYFQFSESQLQVINFQNKYIHCYGIIPYTNIQNYQSEAIYSVWKIRIFCDFFDAIIKWCVCHSNTRHSFFEILVILQHCRLNIIELWRNIVNWNSDSEST